MMILLFLACFGAQLGEAGQEFWTGAMVRDGAVSRIELVWQTRGTSRSGNVHFEDWLLELPIEIEFDGDHVTVPMMGTQMYLLWHRESGEMLGTIDTGAEAPARVHLKRVPYPRPTPFRQEEVQFSSRGDTLLPGTVLLPNGPGPFPGTVMLAGRSYGSRYSMFPFAALLARHGIAALIFDGRGKGESGGDALTTTEEDRIVDALRAFEFLAQHEDVNGELIGFLGESTGGWVAPLAAHREEQVAFLVLVVSPAESLADQQAHVPRYRMLQSDREFTQEELDAAEDYQRRLSLHLIEQKPFAEWQPEVEEAREQAWAEFVDLPDSFDSPAYPFLWNQPYDSTTALSETGIPVLAVYGGADFVVPPEVNVPKLEALLESAGNEHFKILTFAGADHNLFLEDGTVGEGGWPHSFWRWPRPAPSAFEAIAGGVVDIVNAAKAE